MEEKTTAPAINESYTYTIPGTLLDRKPVLIIELPVNFPPEEVEKIRERDDIKTDYHLLVIPTATRQDIRYIAVRATVSDGE